MNAIRCRLVPVLLIVLAAGACTAPHALRPLDPALAPAVGAGCRRPFLKTAYRLVHALEAELPEGRKEAGIGVLLADPRKRTFRTMLMTVEGWVLFDIEKGGTLTVHRAVPPFDSPGFARRMGEDIELAFFPPVAAPVALGKGEDGASVCRFGSSGTMGVDVVDRGGGAMEVRLYGEGRDLRKRVVIPSFNRDGLAERIEIRSSDWPPYTLRLRLIESEAISPGEVSD
ncbi:MAG: hypothetical protein A3J94_04305 [Syntrophus sp. RIFOXYC2_FULL_54_9]|nr:MAG: hypothetical protein A3J94_04305 [Syntrophus sp. RIFOXYC2_FULL_54_9]